MANRLLTCPDNKCGPESIYTIRITYVLFRCLLDSGLDWQSRLQKLQKCLFPLLRNSVGIVHEI